MRGAAVYSSQRKVIFTTYIPSDQYSFRKVNILKPIKKSMYTKMLLHVYSWAFTRACNTKMFLLLEQKLEKLPFIPQYGLRVLTGIMSL
jgi:hypothetical protein